MNKHELISLYMEMEFGEQGGIMLKALVNTALDNGEWHDGFEIAVKATELDYDERNELFDIVKKSYPEVTLNIHKLKNLIDEELPQSSLTQIRWLIADDGSLIITDSLRIGRFLDDSVVWVTKRISWDGINLIKIENDEIIGEWYSPINSQQEWSPLRISFSDGKLLEGEVINF